MEVSIERPIEGSKEEIYQSLVPQIEALLEGEDNFIANMANLSAVLQDSFRFLWTGFYLWSAEDRQLVLGPFQGPIACTRIDTGKGVCGTAFQKAEIQLVDDVDQFPGHIACSPLSRSEIVLPLLKEGECIGVLDIDSEELAAFDSVDQKYLSQIVDLLVSHSKI